LRALRLLASLGELPARRQRDRQPRARQAELRVSISIAATLMTA